VLVENFERLLPATHGFTAQLVSRTWQYFALRDGLSKQLMGSDNLLDSGYRDGRSRESTKSWRFPSPGPRLVSWTIQDKQGQKPLDAVFKFSEGFMQTTQSRVGT